MVSVNPYTKHIFLLIFKNSSYNALLSGESHKYLEKNIPKTKKDNFQGNTDSSDLLSILAEKMRIHNEREKKKSL